MSNGSNKNSVVKASVVGISTAIFSTTIIYLFFQRIGFSESDPKAITDMLKVAPFFLGAGMGSAISSQAYKVFKRKESTVENI